MPAGENAFYVDQPSIGAMHGQFIGEELVEIKKKNVSPVQKREDTFIGGTFPWAVLAHSEMA